MGLAGWQGRNAGRADRAPYTVVRSAPCAVHVLHSYSADPARSLAAGCLGCLASTGRGAQVHLLLKATESSRQDVSPSGSPIKHPWHGAVWKLIGRRRDHGRPGCRV